MNISNFSRYGCRVPNDYCYDGRADVINELEGKSAVVYVDDKWKPIIFFEELRHTGDYIYVNDENASDVFESMEGDYYLLTCVEKEVEERLIKGLDAELIYDYAGRSYYKTRNS